VLGVHAGARLAELDSKYGSFVDAQLAAAPGDWPAGLLADVRSVATADFTIHERTVDASLDVVVAAHRRG
jgi:hypothetical protein